MLSSVTGILYSVVLYGSLVQWRIQGTSDLNVDQVYLG